MVVYKDGVVVCMKRVSDGSDTTQYSKRPHTANEGSSDEDRLKRYGTTLFFEGAEEFMQVLQIPIPSTLQCLKRQDIVKDFCKTEEFNFNRLHMTQINSGGRCSDMLLNHICSKSCNPNFLPRIYRPLIHDVGDLCLLSEAIGLWVRETKPEEVTTNKRSCLIVSVTVFVNDVDKATIGHELFLYWDVFNEERKCGFCDNLKSTDYHQDL